MIRIAVFASGKGSNFENIARRFQKSRLVKIACLVCDQPEAGAIKIAERFSIKIRPVICTIFKTKLDEQTEQELADYLVSENIDLIVLAGYMRIVKSPLLRAFPGRILNIHPSLLPSFKGLNAVKQALDYGVKITGCTVHHVDEQIDHGKILSQKHTCISKHDTEKSLLKKIHRLEHIIYPQVIHEIAKTMKKEKIS